MIEHELWVPIQEFQNYEISSYGRIRNAHTGRLIQPSLSSREAHKIGLVVDGRQYTRSLRTLVANAFVPGSDEIFDTAINLDGDKTNNEASNLVWRPRWFALKYARQFNDEYLNTRRGPINDVDDGILYDTVYDASVANGLLFKDVFSSCLNATAVFPTWQIFEWIH